MVEELIETIYEAAFVPELWSAVLNQMAKLSTSMGAAMFLFADGKPARGFALDEQRAQLEEFLASDTLQFSTSVRRVCKMQPASFVDFDSLLTAEERDEDSVNQHYRARGIGSNMGTSISMPSGELVIFVLQRWLADGHYERAHFNALDGLRPHLSRASLMAGRLGLERARGAVSSLQMMGLPAAVLSANGVVQMSNALFDAMPSLFMPGAFGSLVIADAAANRLFQEILQADNRGAGRAGFAGSAVRSIPIMPRENRAPMIVHVLPLRRAAHDLFLGGDLLVAVTSLSASSFVPSPSVLSGLFDLTPAEARLAIAIAAGDSLKEAASSGGIKVSTARFYLEKVFQKTGTHKQSELVALLKSAQPFDHSA